MVAAAPFGALSTRKFSGTFGFSASGSKENPASRIGCFLSRSFMTHLL
jgi:hypothetical protein